MNAPLWFWALAGLALLLLVLVIPDPASAPAAATRGPETARLVWHDEADQMAAWGTLDPPDACMCTHCVLDSQVQP